MDELPRHPQIKPRPYPEKGLFVCPSCSAGYPYKCRCGGMLHGERKTSYGGEVKEYCPSCRLTRDGIRYLGGEFAELREDGEGPIKWTTPKIAPLDKIKASDIPRGLDPEDVATDC